MRDVSPQVQEGSTVSITLRYGVGAAVLLIGPLLAARIADRAFAARLDATGHNATALVEARHGLRPLLRKREGRGFTWGRKALHADRQVRALAEHLGVFLKRLPRLRAEPARPSGKVHRVELLHRLADGGKRAFDLQGEGPKGCPSRRPVQSWYMACCKPERDPLSR